MPTVTADQSSAFRSKRSCRLPTADKERLVNRRDPSNQNTDRRHRRQQLVELLEGQIVRHHGAIVADGDPLVAEPFDRRPFHSQIVPMGLRGREQPADLLDGFMVAVRRR